ncbi:hypothetical protein HVA01_28330 [Halovibrio variabilis]|uniref:Cation transporter n=1 Tax=Halovibrio variabilis TaxID=31910 RepID=A0A511URH0_9GAMM|nr:DUF6482 family protein [Halovibrio variabilis]GEN29187.1 hypothetical protein HVA01_28330 [Halovibrio variabilis]
MKFDQFVRLARQSSIAELHIESHEGNVFVFRALTQDGEENVLEDSHGQPLRPHSLSDARERLIKAGGLEELPLYLVQQVPYDEMIGLEADQEAHKTPMTLHSGV